MKNNYKKITIFLAALFVQDIVFGQCGVIQTGGSATNMFTLIRNGTSSIAANKALNSIVFIHRNDAGTFGGSSGNLRFDYSTNGGTSWTLNQGVMNPVNSDFARYPNVAIYNPAANTNTANAYVSYMAPTINSVTSAWDGEVTGVSKLNVTGTTESYNQNSIGTTWQAGSLVTGAPGVFWAIDAVVPVGLTSFNIYKGVWNGTNDIVWNINYVCTPPFNTGLLTSPVITDYNIAFDPTGQIGYFSFLGHVTPGPAEYALYPVLYKTINGGATWTGPIQVDLTKFSCITSNTVSPNVPSTNIEHDLVVDVNGAPHLITTLGGGASYNFSYSTWHHMYDITLNSGLWVAYDLGNVNGSPNQFGITPNFATQWQAPQAARTADGTKVFFTWTDNSSYSLGALNTTPDLFGKAFNVVNSTWTPTKNFTTCNPTAAGNIYFPHIAPEVLEPNSTTYKLATVYGQNSVSGDLGQIANFKFLDNITFTSSDFSLTVPPATVTIQQAPLVTICPGSTLNINVVNGGQVIWNTGATTLSLPITVSNASSYSVIAQVGCNVGTASVAVTNLIFNITSPVPNICPGNTATFTALGNALGYTWTPGNITGASATLTPVANSVTLTALGSGACTQTQSVNVFFLPTPTITIAGSNTICAGSLLTQTVSGAQNYLWSTGATNATFTDTPLTNTVYVVLGTAANTCTNTQTVSVVVNPTPTLVASSNPTSICVGQTVTLIASGATSYSLNTLSSANNVTISPGVTTVYTITGAGVNLCQNTKTVSVIVYALPALTVTPSRTQFCKGEKIILTASGAASYTWVAPGVLTSSAQVSPTISTTYTVVGASLENCVNTQTFVLAVNLCTGIEQQLNDATHILVYPNPTNGTFIISGSADITLKLLNELGQVVRTIVFNDNNSHKIAVEDLSVGVYFLVGQQEGIRISQKIIVTK